MARAVLSERIVLCHVPSRPERMLLWHVREVLAQYRTCHSTILRERIAPRTRRRNACYGTSGTELAYSTMARALPTIAYNDNARAVLSERMVLPGLADAGRQQGQHSHADQRPLQ
eukprot:682452-Rhodomonas_salina.1